MSTLNVLVPALIVGFTLGMIIMALMVVSKDNKAEDEGAAVFAFEVLERLADWKTDLMPDATLRLEQELREMCENSIERAAVHEN